MDPSEEKLRELVDLVLEGSYNDAQRAEFSDLIDKHPELAKELTEQVFVDSLIKWHARGAAGGLSEPQSLDSPALSTPSSDRITMADSSARSTGRWPWLWVSAALAAICFGLLFQLLAQEDFRGEAVATIVDQQGVTWANQSKALRPQGEVVPGRLQSLSGSFELKFNSGPTVKVKGPASLMIESDMRIHLDRGLANVAVNEEALGFAVTTPVIDVIDQGTEFGVASRENGGTEVVVFDGQVDLEDRLTRTGVAKRLLQGEAIRVDRRGEFERLMQVGLDRRGNWWTLEHPGSTKHLIHRVRDNIPPDNGHKYFYYQISVGGLLEDTFAYVDHPHQWNGLTEKGLPKFLADADYIKTFNDYRYLNDFEMVVELSMPANLYVFFDDRVPIPTWLREQFEDTNTDIGLDEGPWEGIPDHRNATGPGKSIDTVFSVWHRPCQEDLQIRLGPVGESLEARAMYGIAATPLQPLAL